MCCAFFLSVPASPSPPTLSFPFTLALFPPSLPPSVLPLFWLEVRGQQCVLYSFPVSILWWDSPGDCASLSHPGSLCSSSKTLFWSTETQDTETQSHKHTAKCSQNCVADLFVFLSCFFIFVYHVYDLDNQVQMKWKDSIAGFMLVLHAHISIVFISLLLSNIQSGTTFIYTHTVRDGMFCFMLSVCVHCFHSLWFSAVLR